VASILQRETKVKIVALAPFPFVEAEFGGGERIHNLLTRVENSVQVFVPSYEHEAKFLYKNLQVEIVKIPQPNGRKEWDFQVADTAKEVFGQLVENAQPDLVILEHPWQVEALNGQKFIYDAHNNETAMKRLISTPDAVIRTQELEGKALQADHITFCSVDDKLESDKPMTHIPNGVNLPDQPNKSGYKSRTIVFMGSAHPPNIGAAVTLAQMAPLLSNYQIVIVGACSNFIDSPADNVTLVGHISKEALDLLLKTSFAFVNAMGGGSGTSLKVIKSLAYGLPVISSEFGARGYGNGCLIARTAQEVLETLEALQTPSYYKSVSEASLELARGYSWDVIGKRFNEVVQSV
jgi:glycosyltransferase involved in cell wall biosynthesis